MCSILAQHLGDTTKAFEELLRDNDIDYYMGQSFRDQLAQSSALTQRIGAKISSRESRPRYGVSEGTILSQRLKCNVSKLKITCLFSSRRSPR